MSSNIANNFMNILILQNLCLWIQYRAGHAETLPRQRDHVFRQEATKSLDIIHIMSTVYSLYTATLTIFVFFRVPEALLRCREAI